MASNYYKAMLILENNRRRWLKINPTLTEQSGIYILTRIDENNIRYAYIGQAKKILTRLAQHLTQYQHIDISLKKHGLYNDKNPYGWNVSCYLCTENELDYYEKKFITQFANKGYQLRNKTSGGQGVGKVGIDENKAPKGYHDGLKQGRINTIREIKEYFDKYLIYITRHDPCCYKKDGQLKEIYIKKFNEFKELINGDKSLCEEGTKETD